MHCCKKPQKECEWHSLGILLPFSFSLNVLVSCQYALLVPSEKWQSILLISDSGFSM